MGTERITSRSELVPVAVIATADLARFVGDALKGGGFRPATHASVAEMLSSLDSGHGPPAALVVSHEAIEASGVEALERLQSLGIDSPIVVLSHHEAMEEVVRLMRWGAFDFVPRSACTEEKIQDAVRRAAAQHQVWSERTSGSRPIVKHVARPTLLGDSPVMQRVRQLVDAVAPKDATVLVSGETGTGKEVVARAIVERSQRPSSKFVAINCGALSPHVLESELFGHARGAFTGANQARPGLLVTASGGTLFLDEVSELEVAMQVRLLRVLQESEVRAVGADKTRTIDTRIIAATNRDLATLVREGDFREDLFYRLNVFEIHVPPLRERSEDIEELCQHFVHKYSAHFERDTPKLGPGVLDALVGFSWPGNVRQLENVIERALILCGDTIERDHIALFAGRPEDFRKSEPPSHRRSRPPSSFGGELGPLRREKDVFEKQYLLSLLRLANNNRTVAARVAQVDPSNLRRLLKRHGLS